ncbi:CLUMA_CG020739, isoform A [Clunio marinus]|uniref:CLUMA_CG020739, isoform A n=1 Tax=Clunio marinus TaxID=568069 RepID=A0A1J1J9T8_9DIPT|nr:CLUMA_CG020739, isoform A [Clunio marinus]
MPFFIHESYQQIENSHDRENSIAKNVDEGALESEKLNMISREQEKKEARTIYLLFNSDSLIQSVKKHMYANEA